MIFSFQAFKRILKNTLLFLYKSIFYFIGSIIEIIGRIIFGPGDLSFPPSPLEVDRIVVSETYENWIKVSGVKQFKPERPKGSIEITIPFDKFKNTNISSSHTSRSFNTNLVADTFTSAELGFLQIKEFGKSNLNKQTYLDLQNRTIPITINTQEIDFPNMEDISRFDTVLSYNYEPSVQKKLVDIKLKILDADADEDEKTFNKISEDETDFKNIGTLLLEHFKNQVDVNPELIIKFQLQTSLPKTFASIHESITVDYMTLIWPLDLPHWKANLSADTKPIPIDYFPEEELIEWTDIELKKLDTDNQTEEDYTHYISDEYRLKIKDPSEIFSSPTLKGHISIKLFGLLSELKIINFPNRDLLIEEETFVETDYELSLEDYFTQSIYYPKQHLYFPGVVLNNNRLADVFMLLRDEGFEIPYGAWVELDSEQSINDLINERNRFVIKAVKEEGTKELVLWLILEGTTSGTTRQRELLGKNKYTTDLPTGLTVVDIWGCLQGDYKRVVNVINEIQIQLKEQFRHVSLAD